MRFSTEALARMDETLDPVFEGEATDRETLVAIAMGYAVPIDEDVPVAVELGGSLQVNYLR